MTGIIATLGTEQVLQQHIDASIVTIGRGKKADVRVDDLHFSRLHAQLERHATGFVLRDLGSANGTRVNGLRVEDPVDIGLDDEIRIGEHILSLVDDGQDDPPSICANAADAFVVVVHSEGQEPKSYALLGDAFSIGRSDDADIPLRSKRISRKHAQLKRADAQGGFLVDDKGSQNGTWVNGARITQPTLVREGDSMWIPPYHLHLARHEVALPLTLSDIDDDDDLGGSNPFSAAPSLLLRDGDLGEGSGRSLAAARDAWSAHLSSMENEEHIWEGGTFTDTAQAGPPPVQSFEDTSKQREKNHKEPGVATIETGAGELLAEITMNRAIVVVGDTPDCDVVLAGGDFPLGPRLVLTTTEGGDLAVVQLYARRRPAVLVRAGKSVDVGPLSVTYAR